jgi:hypothetical protein
MKLRQSIRILWTLGVAALGSTLASAQGYTSQRLDTQSNQNASLYDVSDSMVFVGYREEATIERGFLWDRTRNLQFALPSLPGSSTTRAYSISPNGTWVTGNSKDAGGVPRCYLIGLTPLAGAWSASIQPISDGNFNGEAAGYDVNSDADIVGLGQKNGAGATFWPMYVEKGSGANFSIREINRAGSGLGTPREGGAYGISPRNGGNTLIVGCISNGSNAMQPFYSKTSTLTAGGGSPTRRAIIATSLNTPGFTHGVVRSVNSSGLMVGYVWNSGYTNPGFITPQGLQMPADAVPAIWKLDLATNGVQFLLLRNGDGTLVRGGLVRVSENGSFVGMIQPGSPVGIMGRVTSMSPLTAFITPLGDNSLNPVGGYLNIALNRSYQLGWGINNRNPLEAIAAQGVEITRRDGVALRQYNDILNGAANAIGSVSISTLPIGAGSAGTLTYAFSYNGDTTPGASSGSDNQGEAKTLTYWMRFSGDNFIPSTQTAFVARDLNAITVNASMYGWSADRIGETLFAEGTMPGYQIQSGSASIVSPAPSLASISPSVAYVGQSALPISVTGSNFWYNPRLNIGSNLFVNGLSIMFLQTISGPGTSATATVPASFFASPTNLSVTVFNQANGGSSSARTLEVRRSATALSAASTTGPMGGTVTVSGVLRANNPQDNTRGVQGKTVTLSYLGQAVGSAVTNASGAYSANVTLSSFPVTGSNQVSVAFAGDTGYEASNAIVAVSISNTPPVAAMAGGCFDFGGGPSRITVPNFGQLAPGGDLTIEVWQRGRSVRKQASVLIEATFPNRIGLFGTLPSSGYLFQYGNTLNGGQLFSPAASAENQWVKVVGTYTALTQTVRLFVVNQAGTVLSSNSAQVTQPFIVQPGTMWIGGLNVADNNGWTFDGELDGVRITPRAKSLSEILSSLRAPVPDADSEAWELNAVTNGTTPNALRPGTTIGTIANLPAWKASTAPMDEIRLPLNGVRSFSLGAWDPDGQSLTFEIVQAPSAGTLTLSGSVATYTPPTAFTGTVPFTYRVSDGLSWSAPTTANLVVEPATRFVSLAVSADAGNLPAGVVMSYEIWQGTTLVRTATGITTSGGVLSIPMPVSGNVSLRVRSKSSLWKRLSVQVPAAAGSTPANVSLFGGDVEDNGVTNNEVDILDYIALSEDYELSSDQPGWRDRADFDHDGVISILDYLILSQNFERVGDN